MHARKRGPCCEHRQVIFIDTSFSRTFSFFPYRVPSSEQFSNIDHGNEQFLAL